MPAEDDNAIREYLCVRAYLVSCCICVLLTLVNMCARLAQLVRSLATDQKVPGSVPCQVEVELWATFFHHTVRGQGR